MQIQDMKQLMKAIDDLEVEFAKQQAEYQNKVEAMQTALRRMGQQMVAELEGLPPEKWPKGVAPAEGGVKADR